jgi:hypothetical protein
VTECSCRDIASTNACTCCDRAKHVYLWDDEDWIVASSTEEAREFYAAHVGMSLEELAAEYEGAQVEQLDDDAKLSIVCNDDGEPDDSGEAVERTCGEWADLMAPGLLCSRNY